MKKALLKDSIKEIKNTYKRFISILLMAFLGVGFFAGLRASSPDMLDTIDKYYKDQNVYDIQILSTLGLKDKDIQKLSEIENVDEVYGSYDIDGKVEIENSEIITKVITLSKINEPVLLEGSMPQNEAECLVEPSFLKSNNKKIGDKLIIEIEKTTNDDGEKVDFLKNKELTITGTVKSPLYISRDRGTSTLGAGKINYYVYINPENINAKDVYTSIYIKIKNADEYVTSSKEYEDYVENVESDIEKIKDEMELERKEELVKKANEKIEDAESKLNAQKQEANEKIDDGKKEIEDAKTKIEDAETEISSQEKQLKNAKTQIDSAKNELKKQEENFNNQEADANKQIEELEVKNSQMKENLSQVNTGLDEVNKNYSVILKQLENENLTDDEKNFLETKKTELEYKKQELDKTKLELENGINKIEESITLGKQELQNAKKAIENGKKEIEKNEAKYNTGKAEINKAKTEINNSKQEITKAEEELEKNIKETNEKIAEAEEEIEDSKQEILDIKKPTIYILDRNENAGYVSFIQDTKSIENIAKVFPLVFFLVATLISLTSMTRMVEEQRTQIGILKALGYNNFQITLKYIIYASLACIIGGILGMCLGFYLLPKVLWILYGMMYQITDIYISFNLKYATLGLVLIGICVLGATIYTALKELLNTPSVLMRPKPPKSGHRVFLEKIPFIWKKLNFSNKVTIRNLFRYKKRFYMTIVGIAGCTALILTGFGIKDSITELLPNQFEKVFCYDFQITLKDDLSEEEKNKFLKEIEQNKNIEKTAKVYISSEEVESSYGTEEVQIIVPDDENLLDGIININDVKSKDRVLLKENEICLTDKVASLLKVKEGDTVTLKNTDDKQIDVKVSNIVENYVSHYIFMNKTTYEKLYSKQFKDNVLLTKNINLSIEEADDLATEIMNKDEVASISNISSLENSIQDMMSSLNYVVIILIVSAGLLAFVVLYNLSNVNISERIRELATIKVLGFYDKEVYKYVTKETVILTIIGILIGLGMGYLLNYYILGTCEINMLRFTKTVNPVSYFYSTAITVIFTIVVNIATYFSLKKINMIESLKSIE